MDGDAAAGPITGRWTAADMARAALAVGIAIYLSAYLRDAGAFLLLDHVDLAVHEAGHVLFSPFGEFIGIAGGTLLQLLVPVMFAVYFARRRDRWAAAIVTFWVAQSLFNVATYAADARAELLPLVGGDDAIHDWRYMLGVIGWLDHDTTIAGALRAVGFLLWALALGLGVWWARRGPAAADARRPADRLI